MSAFPSLFPSSLFPVLRRRRGRGTMDAVLDEFYAQIVAKLERDELIPAYKRTMHREYLATVLDGLCGPWCGRDRRSACEAAVAGAVTFHGRAVRDNGSVCPLGKHHGMLYVVARLAVDADVGPGPVAALLTAIYTCEETLEKLFEGAVVGSKVARMISGRSSDFGATAAENRASLTFFLDRATSARLLLDGRRLQDVRMRSYRADPVVVAAAAGDAAAVALLLRYGVDGPAVRSAIAYLLQMATDDRGRPSTDGARSCLDLLRRAVASEHSGADDNNDCSGDNNDYSGDNNDCSGDNNDCSGDVRDPSPLLHLARCAVRKSLHDNFCLPHGIRQLPLPGPLMRYLDLEC